MKNRLRFSQPKKRRKRTGKQENCLPLQIDFDFYHPEIGARSLADKLLILD